MYLISDEDKYLAVCFLSFRDTYKSIIYMDGSLSCLGFASRYVGYELIIVETGQ